MVETGLIVIGACLLGLFLIIGIVNRFGVVRKRLPPLIVNRRLQSINGVIKNTKEFCVHGKNGKCFPDKRNARAYAESIATRI